MKPTPARQRIVWIDCLKGIAIISVVVSHVSYFLSEIPQRVIPQAIWTQMVFPFFWLYALVGLTTWLSMNRLMKTGRKPFFTHALTFWAKRIRYVFLYIFGAMFFYFVMPSVTYGEVSLPDFIVRLRLFSVQPSHHFFLTLFEFILVGPFIVWILSKIQTISLYLLSVMIVAILLIPVSKPLYYPILAMPRPIFLGGWAFLLFYLGMGYMKFSSDFTKLELPVAVAACVTTIIYDIYAHTAISPQLITFPTICWSIFSFLLAKKIVEVTAKWKSFWNVVSYIGTYSLIIYLCHWSILEYLTKFPESRAFISVWGFIMLTVIGLGVPVVIGILLKSLLQRLTRFLSRVKIIDYV